MPPRWVATGTILEDLEDVSATQVTGFVDAFRIRSFFRLL